MRQTLKSRVGAFAADETGAITTDFVVMTAAIMGIGMAAMMVISGGVEDLSGDITNDLASNDAIFRSGYFGRDRLTVLLEGPRDYVSETTMRNRYTLFSDPSLRTDAQVRNAHRTWSRRLADPAYSNPGNAADWVRILDQALDVRDLEPHDDI